MNRPSRNQDWELVYSANRVNAEVPDVAGKNNDGVTDINVPEADIPRESNNFWIICLLFMVLMLLIVTAVVLFYWKKKRTDAPTKEEKIYPSIKMNVFPAPGLTKHCHDIELASPISPSAPIEECLHVNQERPETSPASAPRPLAPIGYPHQNLSPHHPYSYPLGYPNPTSYATRYQNPTAYAPRHPNQIPYQLTHFPRPIINSPTIPQKRPRQQSPEPQFLMQHSDLFFVIQDEANQIHRVDVNNSSAFFAAENPFEERINYEYPQVLKFFDDDGNEHRGTILFKGGLAEAQAYISSNCSQAFLPVNEYEQGQSSQMDTVEHNEFNQGATVAVQIESLKFDLKSEISKLQVRVLTLEGKKAASLQPRAPKTELKTMVNGIPREIKLIENADAYILEKIQSFRARSSPIVCGNRGDIRDMLYSNQEYFLKYFDNANTCGGAVLKLLVGPDVAKEGFLPNAHYDKGPKRRNGLMKKTFSFAVTSAFYLSLDLLIANIFIADHRKIYHCKARTYVNQNVDTLKTHTDRNGTEHAVVGFGDGWAFTREEALKDSHKAEKDANKDNILETYRWIVQLGMDSAVGTDVTSAIQREMEAED
uniref:Uncharacterized protein n=1 Tax=Panagrolaimus davidi TaxID=227884 RepID=A0A914Q0I4_9BILA